MFSWLQIEGMMMMRRPILTLAFAYLATLPALASPFLAALASPVVKPIPIPPSANAIYNAADKAIEGVVSYPGNSVAGLTITIYLDGSGQSFGSATTTTQGTYSLPFVAAPASPHLILAKVTVTQTTFFGTIVTPIATATATYTGVGTVYYVSPTGSDTANGTGQSTPWQTVAKANTGPTGGYTSNDTIAFQGGQAFAGCFSIDTTKVPGSFKTNVFSVVSYGTGKATITSNCGTVGNGTNGGKSALFTNTSVSGFFWSGVNLVGSASPLTQYGIVLQNSNPAGATPLADTMTVQNSDISGFQVPSTATSDSADEILVTGYALTGYCGALNNVKVLNNTLHGSSVTSADDNGIGGYGCGQDIYNALYQGNTVFNIGGRSTAPGGASGNGMVMNGINGGIEQYNVVHNLGANTRSCGGPGAIWDYNANNILTQFNEAYGMAPTSVSQTQAGGGTGCDWIAFDADANSTNVTIQYNYSHNNAGPGFLDYTAGGPHYGIIFRGNISVNDNWLVNDAGGSFAGNPDNSVQYYNNTIVKSSTASPAYIVGTTPPTCFSAGYNGAYAGRSYWYNNVCYNNTKDIYGRTLMLDGSSGASGIGNIAVDFNDYYNNGIGITTWKWPTGGGSYYTSLALLTATAAIEAHSTTANPLLISPDLSVGTTCGSFTGPQPCPTGYAVSVGSPVIGTGLDLTTFGLTPVRDYYGTTIPTTGINMGAYQGAGH